MDMLRSRYLAALTWFAAVGLLAISPIFAGEQCNAPAAGLQLAGTADVPTWLAAGSAAPKLICNAWIGTVYYTDATHTTATGSCSITCLQYDNGSAAPTFSLGGTCAGSSSSFSVRRNGQCPCPN
jgi:hypothetical protein